MAIKKATPASVTRAINRIRRAVQVEREARAEVEQAAAEGMSLLPGKSRPSNPAGWREPAWRVHEALMNHLAHLANEKRR